MDDMSIEELRSLVDYYEDFMEFLDTHVCNMDTLQEMFEQVR